MRRICNYCGDNTECILIEMLSWVCKRCFIRFYEYWAERSRDFLGLYLDFKLQETYNAAVDVMKSQAKEIEIAKIMNAAEPFPSFIYYDEEKIGKIKIDKLK